MKFLLRKNHDKNFSNMIYRKLARKIFMNMLNIGSNQVLQDGLIKIILKFSNILSEMQKGCLNFCATNHQLLIYGAECIDFIVNNPWVVLSPKLWSTVKYFFGSLGKCLLCTYNDVINGCLHFFFLFRDRIHIFVFQIRQAIDQSRGLPV